MSSAVGNSGVEYSPLSALMSCHWSMFAHTFSAVILTEARLKCVKVIVFFPTGGGIIELQHSQEFLKNSSNKSNEKGF